MGKVGCTNLKFLLNIKKSLDMIRHYSPCKTCKLPCACDSRLVVIYAPELKFPHP